MISVLRLQDVRNYEAAEFRPAPETTLVVGSNGSGKSSLLEAAGVFSTLSSPRAGSLRVLVREGREGAGSHLETDEGTVLEIRLRGGRAYLRAGGSGASARTFLGRFRSVLFTPEDLDLVRGEPALRRQALDALVVQLRPAYRGVRAEFERALRQRNAALREGLEAQVRLYGEAVAVPAAAVIAARREVCEELTSGAVEMYGELAPRGRLGLAYLESTGVGDLEGDDLVDLLRRTYEERVRTDLERGRTSVGPHRDDLEVLVDGRQARWYASRGEQRSAALALRMAELNMLPDAVLMLDDVLSELDPDRRCRVLALSRSSRQTIVTTTDREVVPPEAFSSVWRVSDGELQEVG